MWIRESENDFRLVTRVEFDREAKIAWLHFDLHKRRLVVGDDCCKLLSLFQEGARLQVDQNIVVLGGLP